MPFLKYLKDRAVPLFLIFLSILVLGFLLYWVFRLSVIGTLFACFTVLGGIVIALVWDYFSRRRFYKELASSLDSLDEAYYLTEIIERPSFTEGALFYDALEKANKHANDRIAHHKLGAQEYREYVETWIHEIKTPLSAARLIVENNPNESTQPLENELDRTEGYIEQALYYSRSTSLEHDYAIRQVNLDALIKSVVRKHSRLLIDSGITPSFEGLDLTVYTDAKWLDFIISQIIANSVKYRNEESPTLAFFARQYENSFEGSSVVLSIADNGIGIPATDIGRVFEKGFTGENGRLYAKSTGIGLYLCKKLCTQMKIATEIDSTPEKGTTVSITFPLSKMYFLE